MEYYICNDFLKNYLGCILAVQWLRHQAPNAGSISGQRTRSHMPQLKILHAATKTWSRWVKKKKKKKKYIYIFNYLDLYIYSGEGNGNPLQYSCLENPRDGGAWWAAVYGVTQSQTWLKQLMQQQQQHTYIQVQSCPLHIKWKERTVYTVWPKLCKQRSASR